MGLYGCTTWVSSVVLKLKHAREGDYFQQATFVASLNRFGLQTSFRLVRQLTNKSRFHNQVRFDIQATAFAVLPAPSHDCMPPTGRARLIPPHSKLFDTNTQQGFPTIKIFGADKRKPTDFQGERSATAIVTGGMAAARDLVKSRQSGGSGSKKAKTGETKDSAG